MPAGRPTKLTPELIEEAWIYLDGQHQIEGDVIPSVAGLCDFLNIGRSTIYQWADEGSSEIADILDVCNTRQERILVNSGLSGEFNSTITKLVLGKHGYHERQEHSGPGGGPIQTESKKLEVVGVKPGTDQDS